MVCDRFGVNFCAWYHIGVQPNLFFMWIIVPALFVEFSSFFFFFGLILLHFFSSSSMSRKHNSLIFCLSYSLINASKAVIFFCVGIWIHPTGFYFIIIIANFCILFPVNFLFLLHCTQWVWPIMPVQYNFIQRTFLLKSNYKNLSFPTL